MFPRYDVIQDFSDVIQEFKYASHWSIWRLPYRTHSSLLPEICEISPFERQMHIRFFNFMRNLCLSKNSLVSVCRKLVLDGSRSEVGRSFNYLVKKYHLERMRISEFDSFQMIQYQRWREQRRR